MGRECLSLIIRNAKMTGDDQRLNLSFNNTILYKCSQMFSLYQNKSIFLKKKTSSIHLELNPESKKRYWPCWVYTSAIMEDYLKFKRSKKGLHRPGIEPGSPAWQASILPLDHRCLLIQTLSSFFHCLPLWTWYQGRNESLGDPW